MQASQPHVTAIIPSFQSVALLAKHLPAVEKCLQNGDQLLVIEDAGSDTTIQFLSDRYRLKHQAIADSKKLADDDSDCQLWVGEQKVGKNELEVLVIRNSTNLRFAASVNRAVAFAKHAYILLLNNDVSPHFDLLKHALPHFSDPTVFAVGCLEHEGEQLGGKNRLWFDRGVFMHARAAKMTSGPTAWVSGGSGVFDKEKWLELGGFDRAFYPAYWEDIDLSYRARLRGWQVLFEAKAEVDHQHETTHQEIFGQRGIARMSWQHLQYFTWKHSNWWQRLQFLCWWPYHTFKVYTTH